MGEDDSKPETGKTDWSITESVRRSTKRPANVGEQARTIDLGAVVPTVSAKQELAVAALPNAGTAHGLLMQWKSNKMGRKATLEALNEQYTSALDILKHRLQLTVQGQNARADVDYKIYISQLDQEYLEVWAGLGLRNKDVRERTLIQLTEMTAAKLKEVQAADWPKDLKEMTIDELFAIRRRFSAEMMKELGEET